MSFVLTLLWTPTHPSASGVLREAEVWVCPGTCFFSRQDLFLPVPLPAAPHSSRACLVPSTCCYKPQ